MAPGVQPRSSASLSSSADELRRQQDDDDDKAAMVIAQIFCMQLVALTSLLCMLRFLPALQGWVEDIERDDVCLKSTKLMTCLDWTLSVAPFLVLLPITFLTFPIRAPAFRWALWCLLSVVLVTYLALLSWERKHAAASAVFLVVYTLLLYILGRLPGDVLMFSCRQCFYYALKVVLFIAGVVSVVVTKDTAYAWVALVTPVVIVFILFCFQTVEGMVRQVGIEAGYVAFFLAVSVLWYAPKAAKFAFAPHAKTVDACLTGALAAHREVPGPGSFIHSGGLDDSRVHRAIELAATPREERVRDDV